MGSVDMLISTITKRKRLQKNKTDQIFRIVVKCIDLDKVYLLNSILDSWPITHMKLLGAIHYALSTGKIEAADAMLNKYIGMNYRISGIHSILILACSYGYTNIVCKILDNGADPNYNYGAAGKAALKGLHTDTMKLLLNNDLDTLWCL